MKRSLTRKERLSGKREIEALFTRSTRYEGDGLRLLLRPNECDYNRMLVTTRRGFSTAVARNRQKRIFREILRLSKGSMKQGFDLAFILKSEVASYRALCDGFKRLIAQADLMTKP